MKQFANPKINIFKFSNEEILQASSDYSGGSAGNEGGGDVLSANPEEVNIDTITR